MSTGNCSEMSDVSNDSWASELSVLKSNLPSAHTPTTLPNWGALALLDLHSPQESPRDRSLSRSSADSSPPPSPPGVGERNHSARSSPVLPPAINTATIKPMLIDLGHDGVERFFKNNSRRTELKEGLCPVKRKTKPDKPPETTMPTKKRVRAQPKAKPAASTAVGGRKLWQFMLSLLCDETTNPSVVRWTDVRNGIFHFTNSRLAASLWGQRRGHPDMTYEHMSRTIRHYYRSGIILRVPGKRLVYKFGAKTPDWRRKVMAASTGSLLSDLPKDFCDIPNTQDDSSTETQFISDMKSSIAKDVVRNHCEPDLKMDAKPTSDINRLKVSSAMIAITSGCDENNNVNTNTILRTKGSDMDSSSLLTAIDCLHNVQEPAQHVPDGNASLLSTFSLAANNKYDAKVQNSLVAQDFINVQQSQQKSNCSTLAEQQTSEQEFKLGFFAGCINTESKLVDSCLDMELCDNSLLLSAELTSNTVSQTYIQQQQHGY